MKLIKLEPKAFAKCDFCQGDIATRAQGGMPCFESEEENRVICWDCARGIVRAFFAQVLGIGL